MKKTYSFLMIFLCSISLFMYSNSSCLNRYEISTFLGRDFSFSLEIEDMHYYISYLEKNSLFGRNSFSLDAVFFNTEKISFDYTDNLWKKNSSFNVNFFDDFDFSRKKEFKTFQNETDLFSSIAIAECDSSKLSSILVKKKNISSKIKIPFYKDLNSTYDKGFFYFVFSDNSLFNDKFYIIRFEFASFFHNWELENHLDKINLNFVLSNLNISSKDLSNVSKDFKISQCLAFLIRESILKDSTFVNNHSVYNPGNICEMENSLLKEYFISLLEKSYPVLISNIYDECNGSFNPLSFKTISSQEGCLFANRVENYFRLGVEYSLKDEKNNSYRKFDRKISSLVAPAWSSENNNFSTDFSIFSEDELMNIEGNPLPYVKNGIDTPRTFWKKMSLKKDFLLQKDFNSLTEKLNSLISYISGFYSGKLKDAGCDSFSLFTGGIYMSSLAPYFYSVKNIKKAENLLEYSKNILSLQIKDQEKSLADFSDYRFSIEDIEKFSCVVPSYELIQTGDILVNYKNPNSHLGIILKSGKSKNEILILTVEEKKGGVVKKCLWSELDDSDSYCPRRICKYFLGTTYVFEEPKYDFLSSSVYSGISRINKMSEQNQRAGFDDLWKWIPNTGEFLRISDIKFSLYNNSNVLIRELNDKLKIKIDLQDRNFSKSEVNSLGNKFNNTKGSFDFFYGDNFSSLKKIGVFSFDGDDEFYSFSKDESFDTEFFLTPDLKLQDKKNTFIKGFYIRPSSFDLCHIGDDCYLSFSIYDKSRWVNILSDKNSYMAVYDKKLLWRANLYLYYGEESLSGLDWNDAFPWNAPPTCNSEENESSWWDLSWGLNEWNRKYSGNEDANSLSDLSRGNGGQIVSFNEFTPVRTIPKAGDDFNNNQINKCVVYSYPLHEYEYNKGDAGSMDSPFDFMWKLKNQKDFRKEKNIFAKWSADENKWINYRKGEESLNNSQSFIPGFGQYNYDIKNLIDQIKEKKESIETSSIKHLYLERNLPFEIDNMFNYEAGTDCIGFVQRSASYSGNNYLWIDSPPGIMESDSIIYKDVLNNYSYETRRTYPTDEIESSLSYGKVFAINIISKNVFNDPNKEFELSFDEKTGESKKVMKKVYESPEEIQRRKSNNISDEFLVDLRCIVPGDIFVKDGIYDSEDNVKRSHIAIVAYVPSNVYDYSTEELLSEILLIESTFIAGVQSVVKIFSLGDYNSEENIRDLKVYPGLDYTKSYLKINCDSWAIRRLL